MLLSLVQKEVTVGLKVEQILHQIFVYSTYDEGRIRTGETIMNFYSSLGKKIRLTDLDWCENRRKRMDLRYIRKLNQ